MENSCHLLYISLHSLPETRRIFFWTSVSQFYQITPYTNCAPEVVKLPILCKITQRIIILFNYSWILFINILKNKRYHYPTIVGCIFSIFHFCKILRNKWISDCNFWFSLFYMPIPNLSSSWFHCLFYILKALIYLDLVMVQNCSVKCFQRI